MNPKFWLSVAFLKSRIGESLATSQCQTTEKSIGGMFLRGCTFKSCNVELPECFIRCEEEVTCQSFNFAIGQKAWEMNNRTKDARPEDFMPHPIRLYMKRVNNSWCSSIALVVVVFFFCPFTPQSFKMLLLQRLQEASSLLLFHHSSQQSDKQWWKTVKLWLFSSSIGLSHYRLH